MKKSILYTFFDKGVNTCFQKMYLSDLFYNGRYIVLFFISFIITQHANAQFTAGRIVAVQTTGSASKGGSAVTLAEYAVNGTAGTSVAISATGSTPLQMAAGSGGSEGFLTRSPDGTYLMLAGYSTAATGIADITATDAVGTPRVIFKVAANGTYSQVGSSTSFYSGNDIRGAISDGTNYWAAGASGATDGIDYFGPGTATALATGVKAYGLQLFNSQIYFSTQKTNTITPNLGIYALGSGMPTSGSITPTLLINTGTATPEDFSINPTSDVCYIAINLNTSVGGIQKWTKTAGTWSLAYTLGTGATNIGAYGLVVDYSGTNPVLYATTNELNTVGNRIIAITDTGASSAATTIVGATANTFFHGIAFSPTCPLPAQPDLFTASTSAVNPGQTSVAYTVPNDATVTYTWNYSGKGATINGNSNSVTVDYSLASTSGTLTVTASNACGTSNARSADITINGAIRITEYMYNGGGAGGIGEFVEFTNIGGTPVDMTGWSFDDNSRTPGSQSLSAYGVVQPGESVIFTELTISAFRTNWNLCAPIKIIGGNTNGLGREDEINLYDNNNNLIDRLTYGDQTYSPGSIRTTSKSGWVTAAGLGANDITKWLLSAAGDSVSSYTSTLSEIGSPGTSTRTTVAKDPCFVPNDAPTIVLDVTTTTDYLDGGVTSAPASPYTISGVISDPTDPASIDGLNFIIHDTETDAADLIVSATSSNLSVVPNSNFVVTTTGGSVNIKITGAGIGYSTITLSVSDGTNITNYAISYAASAASATPATTFWHTGMSDASEAISLDGTYYISNDDELNVLNVYDRSASGLPVVSYDYTSYLNLPDLSKPEVDLEAATRSAKIANRVYWLGSMSNSKAPFNLEPNRNRLFATTVTGTGAATSFSFVGYYGDLRAQLINWGDANNYDFTSSAAQGVDSKQVYGFAAEGMVFGPDSTTLYIGLRAPLASTTTRDKAIIAPILNFETWFNNGSPAGNPVFGNPIELDLGGRGIRGVIRATNGTYIIVAGNSGGDPITSAIFKWSGHATDAPILVNTTANNILNMEGVMEILPDNGLLSVQLQVISDGGDEILYNDGNEAKDFADLSLRKFRSDILSGVNLCMPLSGDTTAIACNNFTWHGTTYTASATPTYVYTSSMGCDSTVTLHLTINNSSTSDTTATVCDHFTWNGTTYTASATPTHVYTSSTGCDSTVTLHLTINNSSTSDTTATVCDHFTWNGTTYTASATPTHVYTSSTGCDSTVTLHLTITSSNSSTTTISACTSYEWNGTSYTSSGSFSKVLTNKAGCDSTANLVLTITTCTGVEPLTPTIDFQLLPNPNNGQVTIVLPENNVSGTITIYGIAGEKIKNISIEAQTKETILDLHDLKSGTYIVTLIDDSGNQIIKRMVIN
jgi:hypothetical protein